ncbi:MAG: homoserine kinase [Acidobacteriota bacterium]|nr:homoserine kinase [Acidobacteriota bacterium]
MRSDPFTVRVPASTSNLGSGFDTVSAALSLYLTVQVEPTSEKQIEWLENPESPLPFKQEDNLILRSLHRALGVLQTEAPGCRISMDNQIPLQRGLGSSAAAIIAGIKIAEHLSGKNLDTHQIFQIAYPLEGHPDNLAASLLGGWVLSWIVDDRMQSERLLSALACRFVVAVPEITISTREARTILPEQYSLEDTTFNLQRCGLLIHALNSGQKQFLREAMSDRLHQPFRSRLVPGMDQLLRLENLNHEWSDSLLGVSISGSGSTAIALADDHYEKIGNWMLGTLSVQATQADWHLVDLDTAGAQVLP